jgi:hypothetical protein
MTHISAKIPIYIDTYAAQHELDSVDPNITSAAAYDPSLEQQVKQLIDRLCPAS